MSIIVITEDKSPTLYAKGKQVHYHSVFGAIGESDHVFIQGSNLKELLKSAEEPVSILEIGYGTGLNFVLTLMKREEVNPTKELYYEAFEPEPLEEALLLEFYAQTELPTRFVESAIYPAKVKQQLPGVELKLCEEPFSPDCPETRQFDIIYYDAFAPSAAPEMWTAEMIGKAVALLKPGGVLVTYSVTGDIKRILRQLPVDFNRPPGYGKKREMLYVKKRSPADATAEDPK